MFPLLQTRFFAEEARQGTDSALTDQEKGAAHYTNHCQGPDKGSARSSSNLLLCLLLGSRCKASCSRNHLAGIEFNRR